MKTHLLAIATLTGCYPAFTATPELSLVLPDGNRVSGALKKAIQERIDSCYSNLDAARKGSYDIHKREYTTAVIGGSVALGTGLTSGGSGTAGAAADISEVGWVSTGMGVVSLGAGIATLVILDPQAAERAEDDEVSMLAKWNDLVAKQGALERVLVDIGGADLAGIDAAAKAKLQKDLNAALGDFNASAIVCGAAPVGFMAAGGGEVEIESILESP